MDNKTEIQLHIVVFQKPSKNWVVYCPSLKTYGFSEESKEAAFADFDDAIQTFFYIHTKKGSLNKTLKNFGWKIQNANMVESPSIHSVVLKDNASVTRNIKVPAFA